MSDLEWTITDLRQHCISLLQNQKTILASSNEAVSKLTNVVERCYEPNRSNTERNKSTLLNLIFRSTQSLSDEPQIQILCCYFICCLIKYGTSSELPTSILSNGYASSLKLLIADIERTNRPLRYQFPWFNHDLLKDFVTHSLSNTNTLLQNGRGNDSYTHDVIDRFASFILKCFQLQLELTTGSDETSSTHTLFHIIPGLPIEYSLEFQNAIFMDILIPDDVEFIINHPSNQKDHHIVALFDCSLEIFASKFSSNLHYDINLTHSNNPTDALNVEQSLLNDFANHLFQSSVTLVISQQRIHPSLVRKLNSFGILCIPHVSNRYMSIILKLSGGKLLGTFSSHHVYSHQTGHQEERRVGFQNHLGYLDSVSIENIYGKRLIRVIGMKTRDATDLIALLDLRIGKSVEIKFDRSLFIINVLSRCQPFHTMIITAPTHDQGADIQQAVESTIKKLRRIYADPSMMFDNGQWFKHIACIVQGFNISNILDRTSKSKINRIHQQLEQVFKIFSQCLLECHHLLQRGDETLDIPLTKMIEKEKMQEMAFGVTVSSHMSMLKIATSVAIQLLDIDEIIYSEPKITNVLN